MSLIVWIAIRIKGIDDLLHYMDDMFRYEMDPQLEFYSLYNKYYPKKQVTLLQLWDDIGLPHDVRKQEFGQSLIVIGFHIDPRCMTISIPQSAHQELVDMITAFIDSSADHQRPLKKWQQLLSWANWALNIFPLLRPTLQSSYDKILSGWPHM
ncbi:hypothetical protein M422DRAFT_175618 [Sphaerobolus stellatus SS14]|uniref:Uncharacterized protein n=1 Tax=Sphaerobolus stellatus (strain SS14) TaxID=990650 RepID=A0A0C9VCH2_SPHS4|nr:hypothetical protein M422DRAFT_175618 [Sphaerobolus stellatus SS14]